MERLGEAMFYSDHLSEMRVPSPVSTDNTQNAYDIFLEALVLFVAGAVGMLLPALAISSGSKKGAVFIAYGNAFSGGVMLAAGLVHMLADALADYTGEPRTPLMFCLVGVLIPFALEKGGLIYFIFRHSDPKISGVPLSSPRAGYGLLQVSQSQPSYEATSQEQTMSPRQSFGREDSHSHEHERDRTTCVMPAVASAQLQVRLDFLREASNQALDVVDHATTIVPKRTSHAEMLTEDDAMFAATHGQTQRKTRHTHFSISWIILTAILVFHSVLAGFTLGVQSPTGTPALFVALLLHKVFESVAMGVATTQAANATRFMRQTQFLTYCLAAPMGVALGRAFSESSDAPSQNTRALITALTSGSFLYISLVEILQEEFMDEQHRVEKFVAFALGCIVMVTFVT